MGESKRILVGEGSANNAAPALAALRGSGVAGDIVVVRDGAQALDYLYRRGEFARREPGHPAVALLDLKMPKVDGLEVMRIVKADPELRALPVVLLTSSREEQDIVMSYSLGMNAYVVKSVDFEAFVEAVKTLGGSWAVVNEPPHVG